ncbi:MAG: hypothetical protein K1X75_13780 [Leptospirales bacterium]|nr:hypothetical protein [Leptospirales bacterium]
MIPARIGIVGQAIRQERENLDLSIEDTVFLTVSQALANTGLALDDIDTVVQAGDDVMDGISIQHVYTVEPAGSFMKDESKVERDGAWALHYGLIKLLSGKFRCCMIVAQSKATQCSASAMSGMGADPFYLRPVGADGDSIAALQAQFFLQKSGATAHDFAAVAAVNRSRGALNPRSMAGEGVAMSVDQALAAAPIASPINKATAARAGDGCTVLFLATEEFIRERKLNAAWITGFGMSSDAYYPGYRDLTRAPSAELATAQALRMAGTKIDSVDFVEIHELYAHQQILTAQAMGFKYGASALEDVRSGATTAQGVRPINPSGGALSGHVIYASGLGRILEASLQLRQEAGAVQLKQAHRALAHAQAGLAMQANIVYVLEA